MPHFYEILNMPLVHSAFIRSFLNLSAQKTYMYIDTRVIFLAFFLYPDTKKTKIQLQDHSVLVPPEGVS